MDVMERRREIMAQGARGFNYLDPKAWYIARNTSRTRSPEIAPGGTSYIERVVNVVVLRRINAERGLAFLLGQLQAGKQYTIHGAYTNSDGNLYIGIVSDMAQDGSSYTSTRTNQLSIVEGSVTFTPQQTGIYDFLLWHSGSSNISAENVTLTSN